MSESPLQYPAQFTGEWDGEHQMEMIELKMLLESQCHV